MIDNLIKIAKEAGEVVRNGFKTNHSIEIKSNHTNLVTEIDKASEKIILDFIEKNYPTHDILAEESGKVENGSDYLWVIDPLDGTTNFAHGVPIFSISIALRKNNRTIAGAVYDVMQDLMYAAELGAGAFANSRKISVSLNDELKNSLLVTGFAYNIIENPEFTFERFAALTKQARGVRRLGSAAIDLCYVADGVFDGFWEVNLKPWDICAGELILSEAGGKATDFKGNKREFLSKELLATNGKIHHQMIKVLLDAAKRKVY